MCATYQRRLNHVWFWERRSLNAPWYWLLGTLKLRLYHNSSHFTARSFCRAKPVSDLTHLTSNNVKYANTSRPFQPQSFFFFSLEFVSSGGQGSGQIRTGWVMRWLEHHDLGASVISHNVEALSINIRQWINFTSLSIYESIRDSYIENPSYYN